MNCHVKGCFEPCLLDIVSYALWDVSLADDSPNLGCLGFYNLNWSYPDALIYLVCF